MEAKTPTPRSNIQFEKVAISKKKMLRFQSHKTVALGDIFGQSIHATTTDSLTPPAIHNAICIFPVALDSQPPITAPSRMHKKAKTRLLRLTFPVRERPMSGSDAKSQRTLVTTTVGISLRLSARLPTI